MSVNVDFDIRISGFTDKKQVKPVLDYLGGEGLLDELEKTQTKTEVKLQSSFPIIISRSYEYLPQVSKALGKLAKAGLVIELRTRTEDDEWVVKRMPKQAKKKSKSDDDDDIDEDEDEGGDDDDAPTPKARASTKLNVSGKTVVITGTVPGMERKDVEAKLTGMGARCTGSVSKKTDFVFAMDDAGSKKADAERLGIPVLNAAVLFSLIGKPGSPKAPKKPPTAEAKKKVAERKGELDGGFAGKTVVITGTLSQGRSEIAAMLEEAGAKVVGSVSANTHYLVTGAGVGATKLNKATSLGVTIIDEAKMNEMLEG